MTTKVQIVNQGPHAVRFTLIDEHDGSRSTGPVLGPDEIAYRYLWPGVKLEITEIVPDKARPQTEGAR
jgi:hypothetical protein